MIDRATEIPKTKSGMKRKRKLNLNTVTGWIFIHCRNNLVPLNIILRIAIDYKLSIKLTTIRKCCQMPFF